MTGHPHDAESMDPDCTECQAATQRLLDAVMNGTTIEEDRDRAQAEWERAVEQRPELAPVEAQLILLRAEIAVLRHHVADTSGLLHEHMHGRDDDISRAEATTYDVADSEKARYEYALAMLHGKTPTEEWYHDRAWHPEDDEIGGDECGELLPGDDSLPLAAIVEQDS